MVRSISLYLDKEQFKKYAKKLDEYYDENVIPLYFERADEGAIKGTSLYHLSRAYSSDYELNAEAASASESESVQNIRSLLQEKSPGL